MKPGVSAARTVVLPHRSIRARGVAAVPGAVVSPGTISTSGSTGAGLKKWAPITRPGAAPAAASSPPFSPSRASRFSSSAFACSRASARASVTSTRCPAAAATWAMPLPMAPAPSTPAVTSRVSVGGGPEGALTSPACEYGLPLLEERPDSFGVVGGPPGEPLVFGFHLELRFEGARRARVEHFLGERERAGGLGGKLRGEPEPRRFEAVRRADLVDHAELLRAPGRELLPEQHERRGLRRAREARQEEGAAGVRHQPDPDKGLDERRLLHGHDDVAGEREIGARPGRDH